MTKVHVKKDDNVYVLSGKDAGKTGKVLKVIAEDSRVIVEGVNMSVKHKKPRAVTSRAASSTRSRRSAAPT